LAHLVVCPKNSLYFVPLKSLHRSDLINAH
jgi:hypothetical protein